MREQKQKEKTGKKVLNDPEQEDLTEKKQGKKREKENTNQNQVEYKEEEKKKLTRPKRSAKKQVIILKIGLIKLIILFIFKTKILSLV